MFELFQQGGWVMYPILACSLASWTVILERCYHFVASSRLDQRHRALEEAWFSQGDSDSRQRAAQAAAAPFLRDDDRGLGILGAVAVLSPLLGLFGTVLGMIELFRDLEATGAQPAFSSLVGGVWTALLTTAFGLVAALPAHAASLIFDGLASRRAHGLQSYALGLGLGRDDTE